LFKEKHIIMLIKNCLNTVLNEIRGIAFVQ
jgi:hypothetical protein